jgi:hypothetical protein
MPVGSAGRWERIGVDPYEYPAWKGIRTQDAGSWIGLKVSPEAAQAWHALGVGPEESARWRKARVAPEDYPAWKALGMDPEEVSKWVARGFGPEEVPAWTRAGLDADAAASYREAGIGASDAAAWKAAGIDASEAASWLGLGVRVDEAARHKKTGKTPGMVSDDRMRARVAEVGARFSSWCKQGITPFDEFVEIANPYSTIGKCTTLRASLAQMLSLYDGLFWVNRGLVHVRFKKPFNSASFQGVVQSMGVYSYRTTTGMTNNVPDFIFEGDLSAEETQMLERHGAR